MGLEVNVGPKYQVVIPKELRKRLNIKPKDKVLVEEIEGVVIVIPKPKSYTDFMTGLGKEIWSNNSEKYIQEERSSWD